MATDSPPGFYAASIGAMRREGVAGKRVAVTMREGRLGIVGEEGGAIWIDPADVPRMRVGYEESKWGKHFQTRIWRNGNREPLAFHPLDRDPQYSAVIRAFAAVVANIGGISRVQRGVSTFSAWLGPVLMGAVVFAGIAVGLFVLTNEAWYLRFLPTLVPAAIFGALTWLSVARLAPKPIRALSDLDAQLP